VASAAFFAFPAGFSGGVRVFLSRESGVGPDTLIVAAGPGGGPEVALFHPQRFFVGDFAPFAAFFVFVPFFPGGVDFGDEFVDCFCDLGPFGPVATAGPPVPTVVFGPPAPTGGTGGGFTGPGLGGFSGSGGSGGSGGSSQRAAGGLSGLGGRGQGGGAYLAVGQLTLAHAHTVNHVAPRGTDRPGHPAPLSTGNGVGQVTRRGLWRVIDEAFTWWVAAGIDPAQQGQLRAARLVITDLGGDLLGYTAGAVIRLSPTADGYGWSAGLGDPAAGQVDLATVIAHEMGHVLGLKDTSAPGDVMDRFLAPGVRRLPTALDVRASLLGVGPGG
jgi:hypothetical protein